MHKLIFISIWFVILLCVLVLIGWQFDIASFRSLIPGLPATMPQTVTILLSLALALEFSRRIINGQRKIIIYVLFSAATIIALDIAVWTAIQYIFNLGPSLEVLLYRDMVTEFGGCYPGRSSPQTVIAAFLMAVSIGISPFPGKYVKKFSMIAGITASIIPWFALFGYLSFTNPFYALPESPATGMSPLTAIGFLGIEMGVLGLRPDEGFVGLLRAQSSGGQIVKRLLPVAIVAPLLLGWLVIYVSTTGLVDHSIGFAFSWGITSLFFAGLVINQGFALHKREMENRKLMDDREKMLLDLEKAEEQFRTIIESAPDAIIIVDQQGKIFLVNEQTEKLFGYNRKELYGEAIEILVPKKFRKTHVSYRDEYSRDPKVRSMGIGLDLSGVKKNGEEFPIEVSLSPLEMAGGKYVASTVRDFSKQREAANQIKDANEKLKRYSEELEQSNVELKQFAYVVSHDLQAPLRNISGFVQLLQRSYMNEIDEQAAGWIDRTVNNTKRMQSIINDILSYSRVDSRARPFVYVDLNKIFDETMITLESSIRDAEAVVTKDDLPTVWGDSSQLVQIFQNIIGNGIKYSKDVTPEVHVSSFEEEAFFHIIIEDNGIGIDEKYRERIFEIFQRLHTVNEYPGTGIGLAICKRIVGRHGGKIWVESGSRGGSKFHFTIKKIHEQGA